MNIAQLILRALAHRSGSMTTSREVSMRSCRRLRNTLLLIVMAILSTSCSSPDPVPALVYPNARQDEVVDDYHGTKVADPYRWMEALDSEEVARWVAAENAVTEPYLAALPLRAHFNRRLTELWDYPRVDIPVIEGGQMFYTRNSGLQRQSPIFVRSGLDAPARLVIDPNVISEDGSVSLAQWMPSPDGKLLAYGLSEGGADWRTIRVRDVGSGTDLPGEVRWMRFSTISWTKDSKGFYYSRYPEPPAGKALEAALSGHAIYYHRVGTLQSQDTLVYERKDLPGWIAIATVTEDGRYLFVSMYEGAENRNSLYYADLGRPTAPRIDATIRPVVAVNDAEYMPFGNHGSMVYVRTDKDAPNRKIVAIDLGNSTPSAWSTIVPERAQVIEDVASAGGRIVVQYLADVQSRLALFDQQGAPAGEIDLPGPGAVSGIRGRDDSPDVWYSFSSPLTPATVFRFDQASMRSAAFEGVSPPLDTSLYETRALFATSRDGTRVPFFLTGKKGIPLDGNHPTMIYAYGGFSVSVLPTYRQDVPAWLERGGLWVTASIRGGAEYGEAWHRAGMLDKKQNVFDDFIAVAEFLVKEKYTSPPNIGIMGGSNGGLLVGVVMEQRPDLFAVALPAVGVMDMLRYDRFTGGRLWTTEYGSASNATQFPFLIKYSPVHNLKPGTCYPSTLITTADHDDRVVPSHSFKFAAALQKAQGCPNPVLIRIEVLGSHGYRPTDKLIAERADQWAFAARHTNLH